MAKRDDATTTTISEITHEQAVASLFEARAKVTLRQASDAFIASLSGNQLTWRAALIAHAVAARFPKHLHQDWDRRSECALCGMKPSEAIARAYVWGALEPPVLIRNLEALANEKPKPKPTARDFEIINAIFRVVRDVQAKATDRKAHRADVERGIASLLPRSNGRDRKSVLETLGWCSLLATKEEPGFFERFIGASERGDSISDWRSPFAFWVARDGINVAAQRFFFPQREVEVVANAGPTALAAKPKKVTFEDVHPILAAALEALTPKAREDLGPPHLGGPPPSLEKETLLRLAAGWMSYAARDDEDALLIERLMNSELGSEEYTATYPALAARPDAIPAAAIVLSRARSRQNPYALLKSSVRRLTIALGDRGVEFARKIDADLADAAFEERARSLPAGSRVVFRAATERIWIVELTRVELAEARYLFAGLLDKVPTWHIGERDEILAMVPDRLFAEAVAAVREAKPTSREPTTPKSR